ncbi:MAG: hypothetical protein IIA59_10635 [Candidatus Marinimicrobia bacterium]|nr:hypothetical protein [Candidatus Neomarinimicrobiota bacterium]
MTGKHTGTHVYDAKLDASSDLQSFFESDNLVVATRFFRNPRLIADLEERLVPALVKGPLQNGRELRIWCAGCSDGREAYSFAIAANRALQRQNRTIDVDVRGSDLSRPQIGKALNGVFTVNGQDRAMVEAYSEYFEPAGGNKVTVIPAIKQQVNFFIEDIISSIKENRYDILICSLVVLYYDPDYQKEIVRELITSVKPGGYFYIAPVNKRALERAGHRPVGGRSGSFFQRLNE